MKALPSISICILSLIAINTFAQNHKIAVAYPIPAIEIDGSLSDWPEEIERYIINHLAFGKSSNAQDLSAAFQIGYNVSTQSLYIGIEVTDSDYINSHPDQNINVVDRVLLYIDRHHLIDGGTSVIFEASETYTDYSTKPAAWTSIAEPISWDDVDVKVQRKNNTTTFEWAVHIGPSAQSNQVLGIDVIVADQDTSDQETAWMLWKPGLGKSTTSTRLGEVILSKGKSDMGWLAGRVEIKDTLIHEPGMINLVSLDDPNLWIRADIDSSGYYQAYLPTGKYQISNRKQLTSPTLSSGFNQDSRKIKSLNNISANVIPGEKTSVKTLELKTESLPHGFYKDNGALLIDEFNEQELDDFIQAHQQYFGIPGVSVALIKDGQVIYNKVHGVKSNITSEPLTHESLFEAASITKVVFSVLALRMVEKGILDLDKPLHTYLPFPNIEHDPRHKKVTARLVLNHQSGLENWPIGSYSGNISDTKAEFLFDPGTDYNYSGEAMNYLGRVIAHLTKKSLSQLFHEEIVPNFGLTHSYFNYDQNLATDISLGHYQQHPYLKHKFDGVDSPASSLITQSDDLCRFIIGLLNKKYLSEDSYRLITEPYTILKSDQKLFDVDLNQGLAHGFFTIDTPQGKIIGHGGNNGDYDCKFGFMPDKGVGFVVFTNSNMGDEFIRFLELYLFRGHPH